MVVRVDDGQLRLQHGLVGQRQPVGARTARRRRTLGPGTSAHRAGQTSRYRRGPEGPRRRPTEERPSRDVIHGRHSLLLASISAALRSTAFCGASSWTASLRSPSSGDCSSASGSPGRVEPHGPEAGRNISRLHDGPRDRLRLPRGADWWYPGDLELARTAGSEDDRRSEEKAVADSHARHHPAAGVIDWSRTASVPRCACRVSMPEPWCDVAMIGQWSSGAPVHEAREESAGMVRPLTAEQHERRGQDEPAVPRYRHHCRRLPNRGPERLSSRPSFIVLERSDPVELIDGEILRNPTHPIGPLPRCVIVALAV